MCFWHLLISVLLKRLNTGTSALVLSFLRLPPRPAACMNDDKWLKGLSIITICMSGKSMPTNITDVVTIKETSLALSLSLSFTLETWPLPEKFVTQGFAFGSTFPFSSLLR